MIFHNRSNYRYCFIIRKLAKEFQEEFNFLGENTEKHKIFSAPIAKEIKKIDKNEKEITKTISYKLQFLAHNLWQAHYQTLLIIFLNEFIKLTANMDTKIKL